MPGNPTSLRSRRDREALIWQPAITNAASRRQRNSQSRTRLHPSPNRSLARVPVEIASIGSTPALLSPLQDVRCFGQR